MFLSVATGCNECGGAVMSCRKGLLKVIGLLAVSFGAGILLTFFMPYVVLIIIEALVLVSVGLLYILQR